MNDPSSGFPEADYYEVPEEINVYSWVDGPAGTKAKPCQVHLHFGKAPGPVFVIRFKGPKGLDHLLKTLLAHRIDVWGRELIIELGEGSR